MRKLRITGAAILLGLVALTTGGAADAQVTASAQVEHWGAFFGNHRASQQDITTKPVPIDLPGPAAQVASSNSTQYALLTDGTVWAWGQGTFGQLGDGGTGSSFRTAVQVRFPAGVRIAYLPTDAMPYDSGLAVDTDGNAWGWGNNTSGALCLGNSTHQLRPVQLPLTGVTALAGAGSHAVYDSGGTLYSCGGNADGVLGDGKKVTSKVPVKVTGLPSQPVTELVSAYDNAGALLADGKYFDWGYDAQGQLGNGTVNQPSDVPVQVTLHNAARITQVAQGGSQIGNGQTLVMLANGSIFAWGADFSAQLGDGRTGIKTAPERITPPPGVTYSLLATGGITSYGVTAAGDVYAWGAGDKGQIGNGTMTTMPARVPVLVASGATLISSTADDVVIGT